MLKQIQPQSQVSKEDFLDAMSSLPAGVTVITTTDDNGQPSGATLSAVCSLSLEPRLVLACFDKKSTTLDILKTAGRTFLLHILAGDQQDLAMLFASKGNAKFAQTELRIFYGLPRIEGSTHVLACKVYQTVDAGDHDIVIGEVFDIDACESADPLIYCKRKMINFRELTGDEA
tara:strand:- start:545 stop:1066 length:522 start_codon:yes stop_codon:yes gene_type:complete